MEMMRRLAKGELAEVIGEKAFKSDVFFRTLGIRKIAKKYIQAMKKDSESYSLSKSYINGINEYIKTQASPVEFKILGIESKNFSLVDSICIAGVMAYSFAQPIRTDPLLSFIYNNFGESYLQDFVSKEELKKINKLNLAFNMNELSEISSYLGSLEDNNIGFPQLIGSNAFLIAAKLSESGSPILANDPHVKHTLEYVV